MPYNQTQAQRIRQALSRFPVVQEKKLFGGIGFIVRDNMACGIHGDGLIVRVGADQYAEALCQPHTRVFDLTGKAMTGWVTVAPLCYLLDNDLLRWVNLGMAYVQTLPEK